MIQIRTITTMRYGEVGFRTRETVAESYIDPADVSAVIAAPSREIDGHYQMISVISLKNGEQFEAIGMPAEINNQISTNRQ